MVDEYGEFDEMGIGRGNGSIEKKPAQLLPFPPTNLTFVDLTSNPSRHGRKPATNRLSHGTANLFT
jgi:hypothetical protein